MAQATTVNISSVKDKRKVLEVWGWQEASRLWEGTRESPGKEGEVVPQT